MNHSLEHPERREAGAGPVEAPFSVAQLVHTLRDYAPVITIAMLSVTVGYAVCAILLYLTSPAQKTTVQPFRLEFRGAAEGNLPNGVRFSPTEIVATPVLLKVYALDELARFTTFGDFSRSIFVTESNRAYEKLVSEYQARLSDSKLTPLDRDRIQKEFELKRESISKSDYAISYARPTKSVAIPETMVRKVLIDILNTWAAFAINEQHALDYRVAVLSPQILDEPEINGRDPVIAIQVLRAKVYRVIANVDELSELPAAILMKTSDKMTLAEIRMRLEDLVRFRLEPLVVVARSSGLVTEPAVTVRFLESQLAYDQRRLVALQDRANGLRDALMVYSAPETPRADTPHQAGSPPSRPRSSPDRTETETLMPQISDTFLDRLITLTRQAVDSQYRQQLVEDYRNAVMATIPVETAVRYDQQVLNEIRVGTPGQVKSDEATIRAEISRSGAEVRQLIGKVNEIYQVLSRNLNPATQLFSLAGPATSRIERARSLSSLSLYGVLILLLALPVVVLLCFIHNRIREDEAAERLARRAAIEEPA